MEWNDCISRDWKISTVMTIIQQDVGFEVFDWKNSRQIQWQKKWY